jgi:hypothetical protein
MPIHFTFTATGGDGTYARGDTQQFSVMGAILYTNSKIPVSVNSSGYESLDIEGNANSAGVTFFDAPGQSSEDNLGTVAAAFRAFTFTLNVQVNGVPCDTVDWTATLTWDRGRHVKGNDAVTNVIQP